MRILLSFLLLIGSFSVTYAQNDSLVNPGLALHDKGDYDGAIAVYDGLIKKYGDFYMAYYEKNYALYTAKRYQECIDVSRDMLTRFPNEPRIHSVYVNYGNSLDILEKPEESIAVYEAGIKKFPNNQMLHFNKGVTHYLHKQYAPALTAFKTSVRLKPDHASSHLYLGLSVKDNNKVAAVMALSTFLLLEPGTARAVKQLAVLRELLMFGVTKTGEKSTSITLSDLGGTKKEDDFHLAEMAMSMDAALDQGDEHKGLTDIQKLKSKYVLMTSALKDNKDGFFTDFYLPMFRSMKADGHLETAVRIIVISDKEEDNLVWFREHENVSDKFYTWFGDALAESAK